MKNTTSVGNLAETLACEYLTNLGYKVTARNYKDRFCEIDIVATHKNYICFVEVKYRARTDFGGAISAVTPAKYLRMQNSAQYWLVTNQKFLEYQPRLDVIAIVGDLADPQITHLKNA